MGRATKFLAAAIAAAMIGGVVAAGAVEPTTTDPVTLCITKSGAVRVAANDTCTTRETPVQVASAADVVALAARMDAAEQVAIDQAEALADLEARVDALQPTISLVISPGLEGPPYVTSPGSWSLANGFVQGFIPLTVQAVDASGAPDASFSGTVALSASCPHAVQGGASYTYGSVDGGAHTFLIGLGDQVYFGATYGYAPAFGTEGVVCTVTATGIAGVAHPASQDIRVAGEYCEDVDNNADGVPDETFPEKGQTETDPEGTYVCSPDGTTLELFITSPPPPPGS
jgi:hypothetical protein